MITVRVAGLPAPQGSKRHVGNGRMIEASKKVAPWREAVAWHTRATLTAALDQGDWCEQRARGPVAVHIRFLLPRPAGHYGTGRNATTLRPSAPPVPATRPDLDKLTRSTLDALKTAGAYADDSQVVILNVRKYYADTSTGTGALITLETLQP